MLMLTLKLASKHKTQKIPFFFHKILR